MRYSLHIFILVLAIGVFGAHSMNKPTKDVETHIGRINLSYLVTITSSEFGDGAMSRLIVEINNNHKITVYAPIDSALPKEGEMVVIKKYKNRLWGYSYRYGGKHKT